MPLSAGQVHPPPAPPSATQVPKHIHDESNGAAQNQNQNQNQGSLSDPRPPVTVVQW